MKKLNKVMCAFVSCMMATSLVACSNEPAKTTGGSLKDGVYTATKHGHNGPVSLEVTIEGGKIKAINTVESVETKGVGDLAIQRVIDAAVENNTANIDTATGATISSGAAIACVKDALKQAGASDDMFTGDKVNINMVLSESEYTFDVVVVGAGGAGMSAAITAADAGASVGVIEKTSQVGGNTLVSGGGINIPESDLQKAKGIEDSVELYTKDTLKGGDNIADEALVATMASHALESYEWLKDEIKMDFIQDRVQQFGGHSVARAVIPVGNSGYEMMHKMEEIAESKGVEIFKNTSAKELIVSDNGEVTGVKCENNGKEVTIHANKGVILASGGFGANVEMRKKYNPEIDETYKTTCIAAASGDGIVMAEKVNAALVDMKEIQVYPTCNPVTGIISYVANTRFDGGILVNEEGNRFVDEMNRRDVVANGILAQKDGVAFLIWDSEIEDKGHMTEIHENEYKAMAEKGLLFKADSIEELAKAAGIDAEALQKTIDAYNKAVEEGKDPEVKKGGKMVPILKAPFYIEKVAPATHHTMGGVKINPEAAVIDVNGNVIPNLFAAGEVTGGIHGTNRLGGNAITDLLVFGRIAGESASK